MTETELILLNLENDYQFDISSLRHQAGKYPIENWRHAMSVTERMYQDNNPPRNGPAFFMGCLKRGDKIQAAPIETQYPSETTLQDLLWRIQAYTDDLMPNIKKDIQMNAVNTLSTTQIDTIIELIKAEDDHYIGDFRNKETYFNTFRKAYRRAQLPTGNEVYLTAREPVKDEDLPF